MALKRAAAVRRRRPLRAVLLACLTVLLLAQALIGALSLAALERLTLDNTVDRVELMARQAAARIQTGLDLGKPLSQYFGLSDLLSTLAPGTPDLRAASVVRADGTLLGAVGRPDPAPALLAALAGAGSPSQASWQALQRLPSGAALQISPTGIQVAVPLAQGGQPVAGALVLQVHRDRAARAVLLADNLRALLWTTLLAALALAMIFRFLPLYEVAAGRARWLVPLAVLLLAQGAYATYTVQVFRDTWVGVTRANAHILAEGLQKDLERVLGYGIAVDHLRGVDRPMARLARAFPMIGEVRLLDAHGTVLQRVDARGPVTADLADAPAPDEILSLPLAARGEGPPLGQLQIALDPAQFAGGVRARILDAATVGLVALVAAVEMMLLLGLLMNRAFAARIAQPPGVPGMPGVPVGLDDPAQVGLLVRPVMFGFLFAVAMPLSFLPLYARSLLQGSPGDASFLMALPIAAEMACGLLSALFAGRLADRRGWQFPVTAGLLISVAGNLACALVQDLNALILARGLVGLGYGLVWMGLQGFIVIRSPARYRARNMSAAIAGLFAGHLSGAAVGAMVMQQAGISTVFVVAALLLCLPALGVRLLMWPYREPPGQALAHHAAKPLRSWPALRGLLLSRGFGLLLLGSIVPFSIAQVGLLTYALPLYMEAHGASVASVGRLFMVYGLCVIYVGPLMGRLADRSTSAKPWITAGGLVGGLGLLGMVFSSSVPAATVAVVMLALASCLAGGAQTAYMLAQERVQAYGAGSATSVMRAADKFGQMLGPLMLGGLFATVGMGGGLAVTGAVYLAATLTFMVFAPGQGRVSSG